MLTPAGEVPTRSAEEEGRKPRTPNLDAQGLHLAATKAGADLLPPRGSPHRRTQVGLSQKPDPDRGRPEPNLSITDLSYWPGPPPVLQSWIRP